jgi:uncharacterized protein YjiK
MAKKSNIVNTALFSPTKKEGKLIKVLLRNQMIFKTTMLEQSDQKANMLLSISIFFLVGVLVVFLEFESYVHFPYWILIIVALGFLCTALFILLTVKPNIKTAHKIIEQEISPKYPNYSQRSLLFSEKLSLNDMEIGSDAVVSDSALQIGNMVRANYLLDKNLFQKYKCLDSAFNIFLFSMTMFFLLFIFNFVASRGEYHDHAERKAVVAYNFESETDIFLLPPDLVEVSGLAYDDNLNFIYTHNDETGIVYKLDPTSGILQEKLEIREKGGDFEGIEIIGNNLIISTSSGTLFSYDRLNGKTEKMKTPFKSHHNVEGLHIHPSGSKLLFACKGNLFYPSKADKGIYSYDFTTETIDKEPFLEIYIDELRSFSEEIFEDSNKKHSVSQRLKAFAPSGIAIHPETEDIYIISAKRSMLIVYGPNKMIKDIIALDVILMPQPEGICFDSDGNLFISTEGDTGLGKLIRYDYSQE